MAEVFRNGAGLLLVALAFAALYRGLGEVEQRDYLGAILILTGGLGVLWAGVELLQPTVGE